MNILNMLYNLHYFFSSKCRLFHNATLFGFCITHILNTGCAKIWRKKIRRQKVNGGTSPLPLYDCMAYPPASKIRIGWTNYSLWRHNLRPSDRKLRVLEPSPCFCCIFLTCGTFRRPSVTKAHGIISKVTKCDWMLQSRLKTSTVERCHSMWHLLLMSAFTETKRVILCAKKMSQTKHYICRLN